VTNPRRLTTGREHRRNDYQTLEVTAYDAVTLDVPIDTFIAVEKGWAVKCLSKGEYQIATSGLRLHSGDSAAL
jgi:hypothetical protein